MLTFLLIGGYYVRQVPVWISWLKYLSFVYWGYGLLMRVQFAGAEYWDCGPGRLQRGSGAGCSRVESLQKTLELMDNPNDGREWLDVIVLLGMLAALRAATYVVLRLKTAPRRV